jgi:hypothetical protein
MNKLFAVLVSLFPAFSYAAPLVEMTVEGGLCKYGGCSTNLIINEDQTYTVTENHKTAQGKVNDDKFEEMKNGIAQMDVGAIKRTIFKGTCPRAYDGSEVFYKFPAKGGGTITVSSCQNIIEARGEPFKSLLTIWQMSLNEVSGKMK